MQLMLVSTARKQGWATLLATILDIGRAQNILTCAMKHETLLILTDFFVLFLVLVL